MSSFAARGVAALALALGAAGLMAGCGGADGAGAGQGRAIARAEAAAARIRADAARAAEVLPPAARGPGLLRGRLVGLDGTPRELARWRGRVVMVVNTASRCGFTPQYEGLERLWRARRAEGLVVVGVPSGDFRQELPSDGAVSRFCRLRYGVSFPLATRTHVAGPGAHPLFAALAARPAPPGGAPDWNFTKYLLDRRGRLAARFASHVEPGDEAVRRAVDRLLAEAAPARPG